MQKNTKQIILSKRKHETGILWTHLIEMLLQFLICQIDTKLLKTAESQSIF